MMRIMLLLLFPCLCAAKVIIGPTQSAKHPAQMVRIHQVAGTGIVTVVMADGTSERFALHGVSVPPAASRQSGAFEAVANHLARGRIAVLVPHPAGRDGVPRAQFLLQCGTDLGLQLLRGGLAKATPAATTPTEYVAATRSLADHAVEDLAATRKP